MVTMCLHLEQCGVHYRQCFNTCFLNQEALQKVWLLSPMLCKGASFPTATKAFEGLPCRGDELALITPLFFFLNVHWEKFVKQIHFRASLDWLRTVPNLPIHVSSSLSSTLTLGQEVPHVEKPFLRIQDSIPGHPLHGLERIMVEHYKQCIWRVLSRSFCSFFSFSQESSKHSDNTSPACISKFSIYSKAINIPIIVREPTQSSTEVISSVSLENRITVQQCWRICLLVNVDWAVFIPGLPRMRWKGWFLFTEAAQNIEESSWFEIRRPRLTLGSGWTAGKSTRIYF
jgi:hypothetical protein